MLLNTFWLLLFYVQFKRRTEQGIITRVSGKRFSMNASTFRFHLERGLYFGCVLENKIDKVIEIKYPFCVYTGMRK
jgi:hypothetical protein